MSVRQRVIVLVVLAAVAGMGITASAAVPIGTAARTADPAVRVRRPADVPDDVHMRAAHAVVDELNATRKAQGLRAVALDDAASVAAMRHAADMAAARRMSHIGSDGSDAGIRLRRAGVSWSTWGEAIAAGVRDAPSLVTAWMASPGHRAVLLGRFTHVGVGVAMAADGTPYWTLDAFS